MAQHDVQISYDMAEQMADVLRSGEQQFEDTLRTVQQIISMLEGGALMGQACCMFLPDVCSAPDRPSCRGLSCIAVPWSSRPLPHARKNIVASWQSCARDVPKSCFLGQPSCRRQAPQPRSPPLFRSAISTRFHKVPWHRLDATRVF